MKKLIVLLALGLLLISGIAYAGPAVTGGLVTYYSFDDFDTSDTAVLDGSGNNYTGAVFGALESVASGWQNKSVQFTNTSGSVATCYVNLPVSDISSDGNLPTSAVTVAVWMKTLPNPGWDQEVFSAQIAPTMALHMELKNPAGGYRFTLRDDAGKTFFNTTFDIGGTTNYLQDESPIWQHFAVTYDKNAASDQVKVYVNGTQVVGTPSSLLDIGSALLNATIGATADTFIRPFSGEMDEFYLFKRALAADEITKLMTKRYTATAQITLGDFSGDATGIPVAVEITGEDGTSVINTTLDADSRFSLPYLLPGDYTVLIKPSHWLRYLIPVALTMPSADADFGLLGWTFFNGDCDGDNEVTSTDLSVILTAMDALEGDPTWDATADLDGDGEITSTDLSIVLSNMDMLGD